jgi:hypothetical protein
MKGRVIMRFLRIAGDQYGTSRLAQLTADGLNNLGLDSFQHISIKIKTDQVLIVFKSLEDATCARAIAGVNPHSKSKRFQSKNIGKFLLNLFEVIST